MIQFYVRNLLVCLMLLLFSSQLRAGDYYWVGGSGDWSDINHWATTSGGTVKQSVSPSLNDNVFFDANSGLANGDDINLPTSSPAYCRNMSWVGVTTAPDFLYRGQPLYIYGSVELSASVRYGTQGMNFVGSSAATLKMNGAARYPATGWYNQINVNKPGSSLTLQDAIPEGLVVHTVTLTAGSLNMSGFTHSFINFTGINTNVRSLDISNATINLSGTWDYRGTNNTINTTNSYISASIFHSDRFSFPKVDVTSAGSSGMVINNTTFGELTFTSAASPSQTVRIGAGNTIERLEYKGGGSVAGGGNTIRDLFIAPSNPGFSFVGNNTITGALHANTPDCSALSQILGYGAGATITFGSGAVADVRNVLMTNLAAAGSITLPITVTGIDGGGNTGWDFQPRATGTTLFWVGGAGDWNDKNNWAASSGGAGGYCVPFTGDDVVFDANSGFTAGNNTITATAGTAWCHNMTWTNLTGAPVFDNRGQQLHIYGSLTLDPTLTLYGAISFKGTEAGTLTANGFNLGSVNFRFERTGTNGGVTLMDNITHPGFSIIHSYGKLLMPNRILHLYRISTETSGTRTLDISNSTITLEYEWETNASNNTWVNNGAGSFIIAKGRFLTNGLTYPKVQFDGAGSNVAIANANITELLFTNPVLTFGTVALGGGNTIGTLEFKGAAEIRGNNTITNLLLAPSRNYNLRDVQTINGLFRYQNPDCSGLGELRGVAGVATLNFGPSSTKDMQNVLLQNIAATGAGLPVAVAGADAGGNSGFNFSASGSGARYWVGGSGDWNDGAHWSATSGGQGGACVPTIANDVFFDANSFSSGSSTVTIAQGHAYCRNMNWTGATFAPTFTKNASFNLEVWGNLVMNPAVRMNTPGLGNPMIFTGPASSTITANGTGLGDFDFAIDKPAGIKVTLMDNYSNSASNIDVRSGDLDLSGRTVTMAYITDASRAAPINLNISNATIIGGWHAVGSSTTVQAGGSTITGGLFRTNAGVYNKVEMTGPYKENVSIGNTTIDNLLFSDPNPNSEVWIGGNNTINRLEFKGKGGILATGNTIGTLIFAPGRSYTFQEGTNTTITQDWYGSGSPCNPTQIVSSSATVNATVTKTTGTVDFDYIRLSGITAAGVTPFKAREHTIDLGNRSVNWDILPYDNSAMITGLGPDRTICADAFPVVLNTDGFFAGPSATYLWTGGSTGKTLSVTDGGTYSVTVQYPDGCSISDQIVITKSTVTVAPVTGTTTVCAGLTTALQSTTTGGVWSTSDAAIATVNPGTGLVTGVAAGTATITYTVTNGEGCSASQLATVTVNPLPVVDAITGTLSVFEGETTTLSSTSPGGTWSSSNTAVATVDGSGVVTGVSGGNADITYSITNANGCTASNTVTVTVDGFSPAKRILSIVKTGDAQEPSGNGGFSISLPSGVLASENINISYTIGGTATAPADYTALSGTAVILAGQNSVALPVTVSSDNFIENAETVLVTLTAATSTNYTYTLSTTNGNASVTIADDNTAADRELTVGIVSSIHEGPFPANIRIRLSSAKRALEDISISYTLGGTALNGVDYNLLSGSVVLPAGQDDIDVPVKTIDDKIIEGTENLIVTLTGGTTATIGNFTPSATHGSMDVPVNDNDNTATNRTLSVTAGGNATEPAANSSFTISLPATITVTEPVTVNYTISGTAVNGTDYASIANTAVIAAGQNSVVVPVTVTDDGLVEAVETVILTINSGTSPSFAFTASTTAGNATVDITDDDNTVANREISVIKTADAAEPAAAGAFRISLPTGVLASEDIAVTYSVSGTATPGTDYTALTGTTTIAAGTNGITLPVAVIDNGVVEPTETIALNLSAATSANLTYTISAGSGSATVNISDNDHTANSNIVLLTKVSDAIEGGTNGQYRVSLPPGVTSSEDVVITFSLAGDATNVADYTILGLSGGNIVIPAGATEVFIDVDASNDGATEGPENVQITLTGAASASYPFTIDPSGNGGVVNIVDANAASTTPLQVIAGTNASEPGTGATFTVKLAGVATSAWPVTVGYRVSGTAQAGQDYGALSTIVIPANTNAVTVNLNVLDDQIIEPTEMMTITLLSGSATDGGGNAFIFPPDPANDDITVNIADDDAVVIANRILSVAKNTDAAEPSFGGSYTVSLPAGYSSAANTTLNYVMSGTATRNTDYTVSTITLPAYRNSVVIPLQVTDDKIIENTETAILTLNAGTAGVDGNSFSYAPSPVSSSANLNITDDDNTAANRMLSAVATADATEGGSAGSFSIKLPDGITAKDPISVNYTVAGSATSGVDYAALTGTATIPVGQNSVPVTLTAINDGVIELTETVALTITNGTGTGGAYTPATGSETASLNIIDNDDIAINKSLKVVRTAHAAEPGTNGAFSIGFEAGTGITSSEDITVNYTIAGTAINGTDYTTLSGTVVLPAGQNSVPVSVLVTDDQLIEPATETVLLTLTDGNSASFTFVPSTTAALRSTSLNIVDDENIPANRIVTLTKTADAAEPGTNGNIRVSLPPNILCQVDVRVTYYTNPSTATVGTDYINLGTVVIPAGQNYVDVPVRVVDDHIIEQTETVVMGRSGISTAGLSFGSSFSFGGGDVTVNIADEESSIPGNLALVISKTADGAEPGTNGGFRINLPSGITVSENVTVNYTVGGSATADTDYTVLGGSAVIPAGQTGVDIPVIVMDDQIIEQSETVMVTLTGGSSSSFTFTGTGNATVDIADDESTSSLSLAVSKTADAAEPGTNGSFMVSLPAGMLSNEDVRVNYTMSGTAIAGSDYTALPGSVIIPAGQNSVTIPVAVINDQLIESTETVIMTLAGGSSPSFAFTGTGNATVNITDADNIPANRALSIANSQDAQEQGTFGSFIISLPAGIRTAEAITVNYTVAGSATADADYVALTGTAVIAMGQNSVHIPVAVIDDQLIEGSETVLVSLNGGSSSSFTFTGTSNAAVNITDDDSSPENLILSIVKTADAAEPATDGSFSISLPEGLTTAEDITVNYTVSGTATATEDYTPLSGSAVIPAGENTVVIPLTVTDDNLPESTETLSLTLTGGTSVNLSFTVSGTNATATADLTDDDKRAQVITFTALAVKTFGDPDFTLNATGGASGNPVTYTSSNPAVATVSGNTVTIVGVGTTTITASQAGNAGYHAAADVAQVLTVLPRPNTAPTLAAIDDQPICYTNAAQTVALTGITAGNEPDQTVTLSVSSDNPDLFSSLTVTPGTAGNATLNYTINNSAGGTALITVTVKDNGGTDHGGSDTFSRSFTLVVSALPQLHITADPGTSVSKGETIALNASGASSYSWANAAGILGGQNSATLTVRPAQTTTYTVTGTSAAGCISIQEITITVIEDYNLVANNVLTPNGDGKNDFFTVKNIDMYPNNEVRVFDRAGRSVYSKRGYNNEWDGTLNGSPLDEDTYYYIIDFGNGVKAKKGFISIVRKY